MNLSPRKWVILGALAFATTGIAADLGGFLKPGDTKENGNNDFGYAPQAFAPVSDDIVSPGDTKENGGNYTKEQVISTWQANTAELLELANEMITIESESSHGILSPDEAEAVLHAIRETEVSYSETNSFVYNEKTNNTEPVDAVNARPLNEAPYIRVIIPRVIHLDLCSQFSLLVHEYFTLAGLEESLSYKRSAAFATLHSQECKKDSDPFKFDTIQPLPYTSY